MSKFEQGWQGVLDLCLAAKDSHSLSTLLDLLLTPEEKESVAMRYLIIQELLRKQKTQREIAKNLNVSIAKITRGSNELKRVQESLIQYLKKTIAAK